jgi:hypothetical protein
MKGAIDLVSLQTMKRAGDTLFLTTSSENPKTGDLETRGWILKGASIPMVQKWEMEIRSSGSRAGAPAFTVPSAHPRVDPADVYGYSGDDGTGAAAAADMQVWAHPLFSGACTCVNLAHGRPRVISLQYSTVYSTVQSLRLSASSGGLCNWLTTPWILVGGLIGTAAA